MTAVAYAPLPHTIAALAMAFIEAELRDQPKGSWVLNSKLAAHLGVKTNVIWPSLEPAVQAGVIERSKAHNRATQWRFALPKRRKPVKERAPKPKPESRTFSLPHWPPMFEPKFDTVYVPAWEGRM